jgi:hypothetical protein
VNEQAQWVYDRMDMQSGNPLPRSACNDPPRDFFLNGYLLTEGQMLALVGSDGDLRSFVKNASPGHSYTLLNGQRVICERGVELEGVEK